MLRRVPMIKLKLKQKKMQKILVVKEIVVQEVEVKKVVIKEVVNHQEKEDSKKFKINLKEFFKMR